MSRKWKTFTPNQSAVLWLLRDYGRAVFRDGYRRMMWTPEADGSVTIDGPNLILDALVERDLIARDGLSYRLTQTGTAAASSFRQAPATVAKTQRNHGAFWLTDEQMQAVSVWFPRSHGKARKNDRAILSGIVLVLRENLLWGQAPARYGGERSLRRRFTQWGRMGVLDSVFAHLFERSGNELRFVIDDAALARHVSSRLGALRGWFPTLLPSEELAA
ncbi:transposase [Asaia bogorensis]|uniref:transposase n=1 Tax=Asaia bogorensis TaxID=91915 RepID=UPI00301741EF